MINVIARHTSLTHMHMSQDVANPVGEIRNVIQGKGD